MASEVPAEKPEAVMVVKSKLARRILRTLRAHPSSAAYVVDEATTCALSVTYGLGTGWARPDAPPERVLGYRVVHLSADPTTCPLAGGDTVVTVEIIRDRSLKKSPACAYVPYRKTNVFKTVAQNRSTLYRRS